MHPLASVVIPAHNEAAVLADTVRALLSDAAQGELDVVVVANGCSDRTADVARRAGARVFETPSTGKTHALRLGDTQCLTFPRVYLDADVLLPAPDLRRLIEQLMDARVLACAPHRELDMAGVGPVARRVHRVHERLLAGHQLLAGAGVYALDRDGHARVFPLPDIISDDGWVHRSFAPGERVVVQGARSTVRPARSVAAIVRRRARVRAGNQQLEQLGKLDSAGRLRLSSLARLTRRGEITVVDALSYLAVVVADRAFTRWRSTLGSGVGWGTDRTSRRPAAVLGKKQ